MQTLHREHCDILSGTGSQFILSKSLGLMLDLSFNFKQNLIDLVWYNHTLFFVYFSLTIYSLNFIFTFTNKSESGNIRCNLILYYVKQSIIENNEKVIMKSFPWYVKKIKFNAYYEI